MDRSLPSRNRECALWYRRAFCRGHAKRCPVVSAIVLDIGSHFGFRTCAEFDLSVVFQWWPGAAVRVESNPTDVAAIGYPCVRIGIYKGRPRRIQIWNDYSLKMTWRRGGEPRTPGPAPKAALRFELLRIARNLHGHGPDQAASERWCSVRQGWKASAASCSALLHGRQRDKRTRATKRNFS